MIVSKKSASFNVGQIDPAVVTASVPEPLAVPGEDGGLPKGYFWTAVAAGVTVWLITRVLDSIGRK